MTCNHPYHPPTEPVSRAELASAAFLRSFPVVADTIEAIRACDAYRLLDLITDSGFSPDEAIEVLGRYRPDLGAMVGPVPAPTIATGLFGQRLFGTTTGKQRPMIFETESRISDKTERDRSPAVEVEGQTGFGEPISTYTARQGIDDGLFVEASRETHPNVLMTRAVYDRIMEVEGWTWVPSKDGGDDDVELSCTPLEYRQRVVPLLMDAAMIIQACTDPEEYLWTKGLEDNLTGKDLWIARNDLGGFTIMFPEDY